MKATEQLEHIHTARTWQGKISTYAQLDRLLDARSRYAREFGKDPDRDEAVLAAIDYIHIDICKLLAIPRKS